MTGDFDDVCWVCGKEIPPYNPDAGVKGRLTGDSWISAQHSGHRWCHGCLMKHANAFPHNFGSDLYKDHSLDATFPGAGVGVELAVVDGGRSSEAFPDETFISAPDGEWIPCNPIEGLDELGNLLMLECVPKLDEALGLAMKLGLPVLADRIAERAKYLATLAARIAAVADKG